MIEHSNISLSSNTSKKRTIKIGIDSYIPVHSDISPLKTIFRIINGLMKRERIRTGIKKKKKKTNCKKRIGA